MNRRRLASMLTLAAAALAAGPAFGQDAKATSFQVEHFEPLPAQGPNVGNIAGSRPLGENQPSFGLTLHFVDDPLQVRDNDDTTNRVIANQVKAELGVGWGLFGVADIGLVVPFIASQTLGDLEDFGVSEAPGGGLGDIRIIPKFRFLDPESMSGFGGAILLAAYLPTGNTDSFNGDGTVRVEPRLAFDWEHADLGLRVLANLGYQIRGETVALSYVSNNLLRFGLGAEYDIPVFPLAATASLFGQRSLAEGRDPLNLDEAAPNSDATPVETQIGLRASLPANVLVSVGGGFGLSSSVGSPDFRVLLGVEWAPSLRKDSDNDGVRDSDDECPDGREDQDGFEDDDGCPDFDNDEDRLLDDVDKCPLESEDPDGFEDDDGCPDTDNDQDGIDDNADQCINETGPAANNGCPPEDPDGDGFFSHLEECPNAAEDVDGFEDDDGCPDDDNDGDGILDAADTCPDKAEVINLNDDTDGCPDPGESKVALTEDQVTLTEDVRFASRTRVAWASRKMLDQVAALLTNHQEIASIRIEVHTGSQGEDDANMALSQGQAEAIRDYLANKGISGDRLVPIGMGETIPGPGGEPEARVELRIEKPVDEPAPTDDGTTEPSEGGEGFEFGGPDEQPEPEPENDTDGGFQFGEEEVE